MPCVAVARNSLAVNHGELGILQEPFPPWPQTADGIARNDFFSSRGILKVSLVQRVFPVFPLPFCVLFFCFSFPDFEIISSCRKFGSYFRGRFKRRIVVPFVKLWFWRVRAGVGGALIMVVTVPQDVVSYWVVFPTGFRASGLWLMVHLPLSLK